MDNEILTAKAFAHRGLHGGGIIENSSAAFRAAIKNGFAFELDVLLSKDGCPMVFHDVELQRLTGRAGNIDQFTASELNKMALQGESNGCIPTLHSILKLTHNRCPILIEIKGDQGEYEKIAKAVHKEIKKYDGSLAIMSFYPEIIRYFQQQAPNILRGFVASPFDDGEFSAEYYDPQHQIQLLRELKADFLAYDINAIPNDATRHCNDLRLPLLTWTVRNDAHHKIAAQYAQNIIFEKSF